MHVAHQHWFTTWFPMWFRHRPLHDGFYGSVVSEVDVPLVYCSSRQAHIRWKISSDISAAGAHFGQCRLLPCLCVFSSWPRIPCCLRHEAVVLRRACFFGSPDLTTTAPKTAQRLFITNSFVQHRRNFSLDIAATTLLVSKRTHIVGVVFWAGHTSSGTFSGGVEQPSW